MAEEAETVEEVQEEAAEEAAEEVSEETAETEQAPEEEIPAPEATVDKALLEAREKYQRLLAEFDNYRKRTEKEMLTNLLTDSLEEIGDSTTGIQIYIGEETPVNSMKDCSVVTATYEFEDGVYGKIGIIGPKRMDYEKVLDALKNVTGSLDQKFGKGKKK